MHVTDIHCAYDKIRRLKEWLKSNKTEVDLVLVSGDIANVPYELCHSASAELRKEHDDHVQRIVTEFAAVTERVYFIPGNVGGVSIVLQAYGDTVLGGGGWNLTEYAIMVLLMKDLI